MSPAINCDYPKCRMPHYSKSVSTFVWNFQDKTACMQQAFMICNMIHILAISLNSTGTSWYWNAVLINIFFVCRFAYCMQQGGIQHGGTISCLLKNVSVFDILLFKILSVGLLGSIWSLVQHFHMGKITLVLEGSWYSNSVRLKQNLRDNQVQHGLEHFFTKGKSFFSGDNVFQINSLGKSKKHLVRDFFSMRRTQQQTFLGKLVCTCRRRSILGIQSKVSKHFQRARSPELHLHIKSCLQTFTVNTFLYVVKSAFIYSHEETLSLLWIPGEAVLKFLLVYGRQENLCDRHIIICDWLMKTQNSNARSRIMWDD